MVKVVAVHRPRVFLDLASRLVGRPGDGVPLDRIRPAIHCPEVMTGMTGIVSTTSASGV
jgi:hypothetical protein